VSCKFRARGLAALLFVTAAIPFGVAGHFLGEAAALDPKSLWALILAPRHMYLLALGAASFVSLLLISRGPRCAHRAAHAGELICALPFGGRGLRFAALSFAFQVAFFGVTQAVEGCPIQGGDLLAGLATALAAAVVSALVLALFQRRLVVFTLLLAWACAKQGGGVRVELQPAPYARFAQRRGAFLSSIASRPPPALAVSQNH